LSSLFPSLFPSLFLVGIIREEPIMTKAAFIGSKEAARAETCKQHGCCNIHTVKRACGHVDRRHEASRNSSGTHSRLTFWRRSVCDECLIMAEQGIVILANFPVFQSA
jgi:hypothetical protein